MEQTGTSTEGRRSLIKNKNDKGPTILWNAKGEEQKRDVQLSNEARQDRLVRLEATHGKNGMETLRDESLDKSIL